MLVVVASTIVFNFVDVVAIVMINIGATAGVPGDSQGLAGGLLNASQQVGSGIGLAIISAVAAAVTNGATSMSPTGALLYGYRWGPGVAVALAVAGALLAGVGLRTPRRAPVAPLPAPALTGVSVF